MKNKILKSATGLLLLSLVACGPGQRKSGAGETNKSLFNTIYESSEQTIKGGTIKQAILSSTPFKGLLSPILYQDQVDAYLFNPTYAPLFLAGEDFKLSNEGLASLSVDVESSTATIKLRENLKWDDGQPLTIDDYIFTYEVLAHKDYTGVRYDDSIQTIVGIEDYHAGKTSTISGLERVNDLELRIHYKEINPGLPYGTGLFTYIIPKHQLKDIPVKDLEKSDAIRKNPVGAGPYKIKQVIPGESIEFVPNEYFYRKNDIPQVDNLIIKILPDTSAISSMKQGEYDVYLNATENLYTEYKEFDNLEVLGKAALYYQYLGFNLGKFENGENVTNPNAKLYDINLRKAMAYALNIEDVAKLFYNGLRERANSIIPPVFSKYYPTEKRFVYDKEKAIKMLDEAGYKDVNGDGIREDKNGNELKIFFAFPNMGEIAEPLSQQFIQDWKAVGLDVSLTTGRIMEGNSFFERVQANDPEIDMWIAAWGVGSAFDVKGLYGRKSLFNFSRLASEKNDELLNRLDSVEGVKNPEFRINAVREWEQNYMENELGFLPLTFRYSLTPVNKRLKFISIDSNDVKSIGHPDALTASEPFKSTK